MAGWTAEAARDSANSEDAPSRCRVDSGDAVGDETCQGPAFIGPRDGRRPRTARKAACDRWACGRASNGRRPRRRIPLTAAKVNDCDDCAKTPARSSLLCNGRTNRPLRLRFRRAPSVCVDSRAVGRPPLYLRRSVGRATTHNSAPEQTYAVPPPSACRQLYHCGRRPRSAFFQSAKNGCAQYSRAGGGGEGRGAATTLDSPADWSAHISSNLRPGRSCLRLDIVTGKTQNGPTGSTASHGRRRAERRPSTDRDHWRKRRATT